MLEMATEKSFVPGDLVLVRFSGYGYWPAKIVAQKVTAEYKKGGRKIVCFGEYEKGFAYTPDMKHYDDSAKMKYISKTSLKKYPSLAKALEQISLEFRKRHSAGISEIVSLPAKGKKKVESNQEIEEEIAEANAESNEEEINDGTEEANLDSNDENVRPMNEESFNYTHEYHTVPFTDMGEPKSQPTKRFKLASNATQKEDPNKIANPSHPFQVDKFNYEIKVEYDDDPERSQGNEQQLSSNRPNEECTNCSCTGRRLVEDTVKIKMEIEMSEDSFARVAHVLPSSFDLNLTQASKKPPIANKLF